MKREERVVSAVFALGAVLVVLMLVRTLRPHESVGRKLISAAASPDRGWVAAVEETAYSSGWVNVVCYTVRLKGRGQKEAGGDLVLEVDADEPVPIADWRKDGALVVGLTKDEPYQYLRRSVDGVPIVLSRSPTN
jgi:hypothetical protein